MVAWLIRNDDPYKTLIYFNSTAGDYIGGGRQFILTSADGTIAASGTAGGVEVDFNGSWSAPFKTDYWTRGTHRPAKPFARPERLMDTAKYAEEIEHDPRAA